MSSATAKSLGVHSGQRVVLHVGQHTAATRVQVTKAIGRDTLSLSETTLAALVLEAPVATKFKYRVVAEGAGKLRLGPVIGILIGQTRDEILQNRHGYQIFNTLWNIHNMGGMAYYFTLEDIDWDARTIRGRVDIPKRSPTKRAPKDIPFETGVFPFPQAIYRRRHVPAQVLDRIRSTITPYIFNDPRIVHRLNQVAALSSVPDLAAHLPKTLPLTQGALTELLRRHGAVYVKGSGLGAGHAVFHVANDPSGGYRVTHRLSSRAGHEHTQVAKSYQDLTALLSVVRVRFNPRMWCVQQAIRPALVEGRPFDLRITVQKNGTGEWTCNGAYARVAPEKGSVVTRLGDYQKAGTLLERCWPGKGSQILASVMEYALSCAKAFDRTFSYLGDLGVDLLVDENGRHWFLEVNAGPGYRPINGDDDDYWRQLSSPIEYASFLSGFPVK